jgi:hypothetical protein
MIHQVHEHLPTLTQGPPEDLAKLGDRGRITFEETAGSSFSVRIGPNYPKNGNKVRARLQRCPRST